MSATIWKSVNLNVIFGKNISELWSSHERNIKTRQEIEDKGENVGNEYKTDNNNATGAGDDSTAKFTNWTENAAIS